MIGQFSSINTLNLFHAKKNQTNPKVATEQNGLFPSWEGAISIPCQQSYVIWKISAWFWTFSKGITLLNLALKVVLWFWSWIKIFTPYMNNHENSYGWLRNIDSPKLKYLVQKESMIMKFRKRIKFRMRISMTGLPHNNVIFRFYKKERKSISLIRKTFAF